MLRESGSAIRSTRLTSFPRPDPCTPSAANPCTPLPCGTDERFSSSVQRPRLSERHLRPAAHAKVLFVRRVRYCVATSLDGYCRKPKREADGSPMGPAFGLYICWPEPPLKIKRASGASGGPYLFKSRLAKADLSGRSCHTTSLEIPGHNVKLEHGGLRGMAPTTDIPACLQVPYTRSSRMESHQVGSAVVLLRKRNKWTVAPGLTVFRPPDGKVETLLFLGVC